MLRSKDLGLDISGCCLVCAVVGYDTYTVAWVGDCAGLAVKKGSAELITESHCCHRADEKRRVTLAGGVFESQGALIRWGLPGGPGLLETTRAFGDWWGKDSPPDTKALPALLADPEVREARRTDQHQVLVLGSDGVFGFMAPEDVERCFHVRAPRIVPPRWTLLPVQEQVPSGLLTAVEGVEALVGRVEALPGQLQKAAAKAVASVELAADTTVESPEVTESDVGGAVAGWIQTQEAEVAQTVQSLLPLLCIPA